VEDYGKIVAQGVDLKNGTQGALLTGRGFVTVAASVTFFVTIGVSNWPMILGLALGGVPAAPLAAWACKRVQPRPLMVAVGCLVILLSVRTLLKHFGVI